MNKLNEIFIPLLADSVESCLTIVVGTKLDLVESEGHQVKDSEGQELAVEQLASHLEGAQSLHHQGKDEQLWAKRYDRMYLRER